jgi:hypothetical protein
MLDVHPPHESAHTWRDFFIHIATIVLGLLIAVGLEQSVEAIHHRRQVAETREALRKEMAINQVEYQVATSEWRRYVPILQTDLAVLHFLEQHPGAPPQSRPGSFRVMTLLMGFSDSAWKSAQQSGILSLMPPPEFRADADIYSRLDALNTEEHARADALDQLRGNTMDDPDISHLPAARLAREIDLLHSCLLVEYKIARGLSNLSDAHPELSLSVPTIEERNRIVPSLPTPQDADDRRAIKASIAKMIGARTPKDSTDNSPAK